MTQTVQLLETTLKELLKQQENTHDHLLKKLEELEQENALIKQQYNQTMELLKNLNATLMKFRK
ncbi:hypothetical protein ACFX2S_13140 [Gilliamella apicola]|uniref:hypothetical protein n=1 Tax=Gilliamella apicola TaxID=1196095 RepID=UPI003985D98F